MFQFGPSAILIVEPVFVTSIRDSEGRQLLYSVPVVTSALESSVANAVTAALTEVVQRGTAQQARIGRAVAGKTGTTRKVTNGSYEEDRYISIFAGVAPVSNPRLAVVVVIDEPSNGYYYAGTVAAPVFSRIVADSVRILAIPPDAIGPEGRKVTVAQR